MRRRGNGQSSGSDVFESTDPRSSAMEATRTAVRLFIDLLTRFPAVKR
jgi:hypothetical protein